MATISSEVRKLAGKGKVTVQLGTDDAGLANSFRTDAGELVPELTPEGMAQAAESGATVTLRQEKDSAFGGKDSYAGDKKGGGITAKNVRAIADKLDALRKGILSPAGA